MEFFSSGHGNERLNRSKTSHNDLTTTNQFLLSEDPTNLSYTVQLLTTLCKRLGTEKINWSCFGILATQQFMLMFFWDLITMYYRVRLCNNYTKSSVHT